MMMKSNLWRSGVLLAVASLLVVACGPGASSPGDDAAVPEQFPKNTDGYADISVQQLAELVEGGELILVNVHVPYEGEIPQTDLFIPYDEIASNLDQLPDQDAPIVLYCRSGGMSTSAAADLAALGYTQVLEVDGGFNAWQAAGYELIDNR
jgi:rhodanese-related sulfurtransferase